VSGEDDFAGRVAAPNAMAVTASPNILMHNTIKSISMVEYLPLEFIGTFFARLLQP
jgi:hypothetical protein